ncbi:MAG: hypothetical protein HOW73_41070 [Polyangiaceae bacterium]|nr:hypothetical protein [Polyangiaceae bacterium]
MTSSAKDLEGPAHLLETVHVPEHVATFKSGRAVFVSTEPEEVVHIAAADGRIELSIRFDKDGPVLAFEAASMRLAAKRIAVECDQLETNVRGDMRENVRGRRIATSLGPTLIAGRDVDITAEGGELRASSQDDLHINGKNVLINC